MISKNKKKVSWKKEFADLFENSLDYIKLQKKYIYAIVFIFFASSIIGFVYSSEFSFMDKFLMEIADSTRDLDYLELIWFIFSNNVTSAISSLFFGAFFGIFPFINAIFNGSILGYVYSQAASIAGYGVVWRLLPHGIFELPAIFISLGLGVHLGLSLFKFDMFKTFKKRFKESLTAFLVIVVPLLALASIIETSLIHFFG